MDKLHDVRCMPLCTVTPLWDAHRCQPREATARSATFTPVPVLNHAANKSRFHSLVCCMSSSNGTGNRCFPSVFGDNADPFQPHVILFISLYYRSK